MYLNRRQTLYLGWGIVSAIAGGCTGNNSSSQGIRDVPDTRIASREQVTLRGAGATFPAPLYQKWIGEFAQVLPDVKVSYQSVGSGAGVKQFIGEVVDFGASDTPLTPKEMTQVQRGVLMLPMTGGSVVIAYNLPDAPALRLSRTTYVNIFAGKITNWNDPALAKDNPSLSLPDLPIQVVHRADSSGTTETFTRHLTAISKEWERGFGAGKKINWKVGRSANGNEGVTAQIQQTQGTIGYVEYGFARNNQLAVAQLENRSGQFLPPTTDTQANALATIQLDNNLVGFAPDPLGRDVYPIITYTWLLVYAQYPQLAQAEAIQSFLTWALTTGQKFSAELGYIPLSQAVVGRISLAIAKIQVG